MGKLALGYGSEWHLLRLLGRHQQFLNGEIMEVIGFGADIDWLVFGFGGNGEDKELKGLNFLTHPAYESVLRAWQEFWPQTGQAQNWDAVGWLVGRTTPELLLVEAKAHTGELLSSCGAGERSKLTIENAFAAVKSDLGVPQGADWLNQYYQEANRLAVLWFLTKYGIPARFVTLCFCGDTHANADCPSVEAGWGPALALQAKHLELPFNHSLSDRVHKVFLNVNG